MNLSSRFLATGLNCLQIILESLPISSSSHFKIFTCLINNFKTNSKKLEQELSSQEDLNKIELWHIPTGIVILFFLITYNYYFSDQYFFRYYFNFYNLYLSLKNIINLALNLFLTSAVTGLFYILDKKLSYKIISMPFGLTLTALILFLNFFIPIGPEYNFLENISLVQAILIGIAQGIALQPGISRLGITFTVARLLKLSIPTGFIYSLLAELCLVFAAILKFLLSDSFFDRNFCPKKFLSNFFNKLNFNNLIKVSFYLLSLLLSYLLLCVTYNIALSNNFGYFGYYMILPIILSFYCTNTKFADLN